MNKYSYDELLKLYNDTRQTVIELYEELEDKNWKIELLKTNIEELEDILYANGVFKHFS
jgi:hypothetical protein